MTGARDGVTMTGEHAGDDAWRSEGKPKSLDGCVTERTIVERYKRTEQEFNEAKKAVADWVLTKAGFHIGSLVRSGHCVYRVERGSGWVHPGDNKPHMVLSARRVYRGNKTAASSSSLWASSCKALTHEEVLEWCKQP
jgi:hypothetical protein